MLCNILQVTSIEENIEELYEYLKRDYPLSMMIVDMINNIKNDNKIYY